MGEVFKCPACNHAVPVTPDLAGMMVECPKCGQPFEIPEGTGTAAPPEARPQAPEARADAPGGDESQGPVTAPAARPAPASLERVLVETTEAWDLPEDHPPDPHVALHDRKGRRLKTALTVGIIVLGGLVSVLLAVKLKKGLYPPGPAVEMLGMNEDVEVGRVRVHVRAAEWRRQPGEGTGAVGQRVLDVHLSVTNLDSRSCPMPLVMLGDRWGNSLAAEFGTPVFMTYDGGPVAALEPAKTVRGHLVFQPRVAEYCLVVTAAPAPGGQSPEAKESVRIKLTANVVGPGG